MGAFAISAIQPIAGYPHILGFAAAETTSDQELFEIWNGASAAARVLRLNKDGQIQAADGSVSAPVFTFESDKDTGVYLAAAGDVRLAVAGGDVLFADSAGIGVGAAPGIFQLNLGGSFTGGSDGASFRHSTAMTTATGSSFAWLANIDGTITTGGGTDAYTTIATMRIDEPGVTLGSGDSATNSAALYIVGAATEATNNYALWVDAGLARLDGGLESSDDIRIEHATTARLELYEGASSGADIYFDGAGNNLVIATGSAGPGSQTAAITIARDDQDVTLSSRLLVGSGFTNSGWIAHNFHYDFTSDGSGTSAYMTWFGGDLTLANGDTLGANVLVNGHVATQGNSETISVLASLYVTEPLITVNTGDTVTAGASVYIDSAPTEGTNNYALWVDAGHTRVDGGFDARGLVTHAFGTSVTSGFEQSHQFLIGGDYTSLTTNTSKFRIGDSFTSATGSAEAYVMDIDAAVTTGGGTDTYTTIATMYLKEPNITLGSGDSVTTATTLYVVDAPTEATTDHAILVGAGRTTLPAGTTSIAPLRIPHGSAPTSPVNGDIWTTTAGLFVRVNGSTVGPLS